MDFNKETKQVPLDLPYSPHQPQYSDRIVLTPLLCNMKAGEEYLIEVSIEFFNLKISHFEVLFSDTTSVDLETVPIEPSLIFELNHKKKRRFEITLSQTYTANGNERYIMLGIFGNKNFTVAVPNLRNRHYFNLTRVSVYPINHQLDCDTVKTKQLIYNENRRHDFTRVCRENNTNLFPHLIGFDYDKAEWEKKLAMQENMKDAMQNSEPPKYVDYRSFSDPRMKKAMQRKKEQPPVDNILRNLNFDIDDATLRATAFKEIVPLLILLEKNPNKKVSLIGYTDNSGSDERNQQLSLARAKAVANFLISKGIDAKRISYEGRGASNPIDTNDTEEGRSNNRRVEFFLKD